MARRNSRRDLLLGGSALMATAAVSGVPAAEAQQRPWGRPQAPAAPRRRRPPPAAGKDSLISSFIMGDDVGWANIRAFNRGLMSTDTPNLDRLAADGMLFTDYYAEASCTAGRANFITGELPDPHWPDHGRPSGFRLGHASRGTDDRHRPAVHGLRNRAVW